MFTQKLIARFSRALHEKAREVLHRELRSNDVVNECYWNCILTARDNGRRKALGNNVFKVRLCKEDAAFFGRGRVLHEMEWQLITRLHSSEIDVESVSIRVISADVPHGLCLVDSVYEPGGCDSVSAWPGRRAMHVAGPVQSAAVTLPLESFAKLLSEDGAEYVVHNGATIGTGRGGGFSPDIKLDVKYSTISAKQGVFRCIPDRGWFYQHYGTNPTIVDGFEVAASGETTLLRSGMEIRLPGVSFTFLL